MYGSKALEESEGLVQTNRSGETRGRANVVIFWRLVKSELQRSAKELWHDLRVYRWRRMAIALAITSWLVLLSFFYTFIGISTSDMRYSNVLANTRGFCTPSDRFDHRGYYNFWNWDDTFQITVAFGSLSFGMAKFIDIAFDIVVGRGGQALLALLTYCLFRRYISSVMTRSPITYGTFKSIYLSQSISSLGICDLIGEFWRYKPLSSIAAMIWIILSASFIVSFPTLASAMTGYKPNSEAYIKDSGGNHMAYNKLYQIAYVIEDASRLNFTIGARFNYTTNARKYQSPLSIELTSLNLSNPYILKRPQLSNRCRSLERRLNDESPYSSIDCLLLQMVSEYVSRYGFHGLNQTNTKFWTQDLSPPSLNISAYYIDPQPVPLDPSDEAASTRNNSIAFPPEYVEPLHSLFGLDWVDPRTNQRPFSDLSRAAWTTASGNTTLILGDSSTQGECQPSGDNTYKWGFSWMLLFICVVLLTIWTIGSAWMWLATCAYTSTNARGHDTSEYKAIIEMATAMKNEFDEHGEDLQSLRSSQISRVIDKDLTGGSMKMKNDTESSDSAIMRLVWVWVCSNKWWLLALAIAVVSMSTPFALDSIAVGVFFTFVLAGILFARFVGQQKRSRCLMLSIFVLTGIIVTTGISSKSSN